MKYNSSYLVCREHINEVKDFLDQFYEEEKGKHNHDGWITFIVSGTDFMINLMKGVDQEMTQNMTFEITCDSLEQLEEFAKKFNTKIKSFVATEIKENYKYHYIEILGPQNICKIEMNYMEGTKQR